MSVFNDYLQLEMINLPPLSATTWTLVICLSLTIVLVAVLRGSNADKKAADVTSLDSVPKVPNRHWFYGHLFVPKGVDRLTRQRFWCVEYADRNTRLCIFYMLRRKTVAVNKVEHAQRVLRTTTYKRNSPIFSKLGDRVFGKKSVLNTNGREWKIHRSPIVRALQSEPALIAAQRTILRIGQELVTALLERDSAKATNDDAKAIEVTPLMKMATMDVFGASALGRDLGSCRRLEPSKVAIAFEFLMSDFSRRVRYMTSPASFLHWIPSKDNKRANYESDQLKKFLRDTIQARINLISSGKLHDLEDKEWTIKNDLLSQLLGIYDKDGEVKQVDVDALVDSMIILLLAGYDTTANGLSFTLYAIASHPDVERKCVDEAKTVLSEMEGLARDQDGLERVKFDVIKKFPYCHAAMIEALRLYPPATSTNRTLEKGIVLDGVEVPAGTSIIVPIYNIHRDSTNFEKPNEYIPERWVRRNPDGQWMERSSGNDVVNSKTETNTVPAGNRDAFLTFSSGARNCAGRRFSEQEGTLLLAILIRSLKFELKPGYEFMLDPTSFISKAKDELPMLISSRP